MSFRCHLLLRKLFPTLAMSLLLFVLSNLKAVADDNDPERYLFMCTGDQARTAPDFLAVINFDQEARRLWQGHRYSAFRSTRRNWKRASAYWSFRGSKDRCLRWTAKHSQASERRFSSLTFPTRDRRNSSPQPTRRSRRLLTSFTLSRMEVFWSR